MHLERRLATIEPNQGMQTMLDLVRATDSPVYGLLKSGAAQAASARPPASHVENFAGRKDRPAEGAVVASSAGPAGAAYAALLATQEAQGARGAPTATTMDSFNGASGVDLDQYFADDPGYGDRNLADIPLLAPSADNIKAIMAHADARFKDMLEAYGVPSPPDRISYGDDGRMRLPDDYPHKEALTRALEENPGLARELQTANALTSHYVELQKRAPFHEDYAAAGSESEIDAILAKYADLLRDDGAYADIALTFSAEGRLGLTADGAPVRFG